MPPLPPSPRPVAGVRKFEAHWWFLSGGALCAIVSAALGSALDAALNLVGFTPALFAAGFVFGGYFSSRVGRRVFGSLLARRARAFVARTPVRKIRDVGEGYVRIVGTVCPVQLMISASGVECVAFERRTAGTDGAVWVHSEGAVFEVDDGSGVRAVVHAQHVGVPEGSVVGDEVVIRPGARVEVFGRARTAMATHERTMLGGLRTAARVVEITGSVDDPVIVREIKDPAVLAAPTMPHAPTMTLPSSAQTEVGVRVAPEFGSGVTNMVNEHEIHAPQDPESRRRSRAG